MLANIAILLGICLATGLASWTSAVNNDSTSSQLGSYALLLSISTGLLALISVHSQLTNATESARTLLLLHEKTIDAVTMGEDDSVMRTFSLEDMPSFGFSEGIAAEGIPQKQYLNAAYRLWNTLVTKTRESAILEKLQRLDRLNLELIGDFNIANLTVQLDLRSSLKENSVATQKHRFESSKGLNNLIESSAESQSALILMVNKTDHLTSDVINLAETTRSIQHHTAKIGSEMQTQFRLSHDDMERMMRYHEARMSTELRSIRDELIIAISAAENGRQAKTVDLGHLAKQDEALLQSGIALSLMQKPKLLRDTWSISNLNASLHESSARKGTTIGKIVPFAYPEAILGITL
ncbi:hypothetical protein CcaCcLH18_00750 [Colletotrichum camelliae]|nr:hypothetical protein CcaCcLH18_00750 [Colletotrichum camelliae]